MDRIDTKKLNRWAKEIHDNATAHGWHEEKHSPEHWLSLIMCEVAEAIEADRKGKYYIATVTEPSSKDSKYYYQYWYENNVKGTVSEEFADIVIRLLDMAYELYGPAMFDCLDSSHGQKTINIYVFPKPEKSLCENAWLFVKLLLNDFQQVILCSIAFMYIWANQLGIDLDQHIVWKMKYNESRPYKHGGKKY